jgi:hypothetical protein
MNLSGTAARIVYAILAAIVAYIVVLILAYLANALGAPAVEELLRQFAFIIAILVGVLTFFGYRPLP